MQTTHEQRSLGTYEFQFVSLLAKDVDSQETTASAAISALNALGADGWEIRGVTADPRLPAAKLLVAFQRQLR